MAVWRFEIQDNRVIIGNRERQKITATGCNEPFKDRYWCPKRQWFQREACPFASPTECDNFETMCGSV